MSLKRGYTQIGIKKISIIESMQQQSNRGYLLIGLLTTFLLFCLITKPPFVGKVDNFIKSEFSNWKKAQTPSIYRIDLSNNSATILIPQFTVGIAGFNQIDWGELNIVEVIDELFQSLISVKTNIDCKIYVNLYYYDTDKYGNKTIHGRIYELLTVSTAEIRQYKNSRYFEQNYDIINQITRLPFDKKAIREWEQVIK